MYNLSKTNKQTEGSHRFFKHQVSKASLVLSKYSGSLSCARQHMKKTVQWEEESKAARCKDSSSCLQLHESSVFLQDQTCPYFPCFHEPPALSTSTGPGSENWADSQRVSASVQFSSDWEGGQVSVLQHLGFAAVDLGLTPAPDNLVILPVDNYLSKDKYDWTLFLWQRAIELR